MSHAGYMLIVLALFLLSAVSFAAVQNLRLLTLANATCLVCMPLLGAPANMGDGSNILIGTSFFPVALFGLALQHLIYGSEPALYSARYTVFPLVLVIGSMFLLDQGGLLSANHDPGIRRFGVRFVFLPLAQILLIHAMDRPSRMPAMIRIPLLTAMILVVEGIAFFPCILLGDLPPLQVVDVTIQNLKARLIVVALSIPFLAVVLRLWRNGRTVRRKPDPTPTFAYWE